MGRSFGIAMGDPSVPELDSFYSSASMLGRQIMVDEEALYHAVFVAHSMAEMKLAKIAT